MLNALLLAGSAAGYVSGVVADPLPALGAIGAMLWAVGAVAQRRAPGRAARRIREAWGQPSDGGQ